MSLRYEGTCPSEQRLRGCCWKLMQTRTCQTAMGTQPSSAHAMKAARGLSYPQKEFSRSSKELECRSRVALACCDMRVVSPPEAADEAL